MAVVARILMTQLISHGGLAWATRADEARSGGVLRITIVAEPWTAPFTAVELASALRLRLPNALVVVSGAGKSSERPERAERPDTSVTVRSLPEPRGLRVERGSGDASEFPVRDRARARADPAQITRRAALFIALYVEQGAPLGEAAPPAAAGPSSEPSGGDTIPRAGPAPSAPRNDVSPGSAAASRAHGAPVRWASSAQLGLALAPGDGGISPTEALTLRGRRYFWPGTAVEFGAKLSGEYDADVAGQSVALADRALFVGLAYEVWLSPRLAVDLGGALQYTHPVFDIDEGPVTSLEAPAGTRLAVRTGVGLVWAPADHLTVAISVATAFSFREREYTDGAGREVLDLGTMILDVAVGAGVRW